MRVPTILALLALFLFMSCNREREEKQEQSWDCYCYGIEFEAVEIYSIPLDSLELDTSLLRRVKDGDKEALKEVIRLLQADTL